MPLYASDQDEPAEQTKLDSRRLVA